MQVTDNEFNSLMGESMDLNLFNSEFNLESSLSFSSNDSILDNGGNTSTAGSVSSPCSTLVASSQSVDDLIFNEASESFALKIDIDSMTIVHASSALSKVLGIQLRDVIGQSIDSILHPEDVDDFMFYCRSSPETISDLPGMQSLPAGDMRVAVAENVIDQFNSSLVNDPPFSSSTSMCPSPYRPMSPSPSRIFSFLCRMVNHPYGVSQIRSQGSSVDNGDYRIVRIIGKQQVDKNSNIHRLFFSLVQVPLSSPFLEVAPSGQRLGLVEYMITSDEGPTVLYADPRVRDILGFDQSEMVGKTGYEFVLQQDRLFVMAAQFDAVLNCKVPVPVVARLKHRNGRALFSRTRVYINRDNWTKAIKNYVNVSSVIS